MDVNLTGDAQSGATFSLALTPDEISLLAGMGSEESVRQWRGGLSANWQKDYVFDAARGLARALMASEITWQQLLDGVASTRSWRCGPLSSRFICQTKRAAALPCSPPEESSWQKPSSGRWSRSVGWGGA
jgi:hypothetical protein